MCRNEIKPPTLGLQAFICIAMYPAILRYDDQAFNDMSVESEKKTLSLINLQPVPNQGIGEQAKKHGELRPQLGDQG